jgi:hypothetical protein
MEDFTKTINPMVPSPTPQQPIDQTAEKAAMQSQAFAWSPDQSKQVVNTLKATTQQESQRAYKTAINQQVRNLEAQLRDVQAQLQQEQAAINGIRSNIANYKSSAQASQQAAASAAQQAAQFQKDLQKAEADARTAKEQMRTQAALTGQILDPGDVSRTIASWAKPGTTVDFSPIAHILGVPSNYSVSGSMTASTQQQLEASNKAIQEQAAANAAAAQREADARFVADANRLASEAKSQYAWHTGSQSQNWINQANPDTSAEQRAKLAYEAQVKKDLDKLNELNKAGVSGASEAANKLRQAANEAMGVVPEATKNRIVQSIKMALPWA